VQRPFVPSQRVKNDGAKNEISAIARKCTWRILIGKLFYGWDEKENIAI
jgi:hypothetical protein